MPANSRASRARTAGTHHRDIIETGKDSWRCKSRTERSHANPCSPVPTRRAFLQGDIRYLSGRGVDLVQGAGRVGVDLHGVNVSSPRSACDD
jgi:hypothetical protein